MARGDFLYNVVLLLHIGAVVVGFGSSFVWPVLAQKAKAMGGAEGYALSHSAFQLSKPLTTYPIWAAGAFGILLVVFEQMQEFSTIEFSQTWISAAFVLFFGAVAFAWFVHSPNLARMDELQAKLVAGDVTPNDNGPPKEALELADRGKQAGMYGGILHLLFLLLMIDMIWKPGGF